MQQVLAWVMRDASAAGGGSGAAMSENLDGSLPEDLLGSGASDLDPADADLAALLDNEVTESINTDLVPEATLQFDFRPHASGPALKSHTTS